MPQTPKINIIYYAYLYGDNWQDVVLEQIDGLRNTDLYEVCQNIYLTASGDTHALERFKVLVKRYPKASVERTTVENQFEYPGIKTLYEKARLDKDALYLYFHTKGITSGAHDGRRKLFKYTLANYEDYLKIFNQDPSINLMGVCPQGRWIWFNFFWVRGSVLQTCEDPKISTVRHYYESWIHENNPGYIKVCDYTGNQSHLSPAEACEKLNRLS